MFGNLGAGEIILGLVVVLLLFGAKRIPEVAASMGKGIREFKRNLSDVRSTIQDEVKEPTREQVAARDRDTLGAGTPEAPRTEESPREPKRLLS